MLIYQRRDSFKSLLTGFDGQENKNTKYEMLKTQSLMENREVLRTAMADQIEELQYLDDKLEEQNQKIIDIQNNTIIGLSNLVESRDSDTGEHVRRTSAYVNLISLKAKVNGIYSDIIDDNFITLITKSAPMHDIGKIVVPDNILKKPGRLEVDEFSEIKRHTIEGGRIVQEILGGNDDKEYVKMAIADVFDALVSPRCYKEPFSISAAMDIIREEAGSHFDPLLANLFLGMEDDAVAVMEKYKD